MARKPDTGSIIAVALTLLLASIVFAGSARAAMIEMKNGRFYEGEVLEETDEHVVVQLENRTTRLKKTKIVKIHDVSSSQSPDGGASTARKTRKPIPPGASNFTRRILTSRTPTLIYFMSKDCPICQQQEPILRQMASEYRGKVRVEYIEVANSPELVAEYRIAGTPSAIGARDGAFVAGWSGGVPTARLRKAFSTLAGQATPTP